MQHISETLPPPISRSGVGGRIASPAYRDTIEQCEDFAGLEEDTKRYDLLLLVKKVGKTQGFTPRMIELLDYYMAYTRDIDWEQGARPIIYQSLSRTALDLGVSERQIQKLEKALFEAGALTWNDSGNHRRYGQREPQSGRILYAYGVDLTPLAYLKPDLEAKLEEKQRHDSAWMEAKRQISWYRRQIKANLAELQIAVEEGAEIDPPLTEIEAAYNEIAMQIRTSIDLTRLNTLCDEHKALYERVSWTAKEAQKTHIRPDNDSKETNKGSSKSEQTFTYYKSTTQEQSNKLDTVGRASPNCLQEGSKKSIVDKTDTHAGEAKGAEQTYKFEKEEGQGSDKNSLIAQTGLQHITLKQALNAASGNFRAHIPLNNRAMDWNDMIEAAYIIRKQHRIPQDFWVEACEVLGKGGAAICLLLTDQAVLRQDSPVKSPPAYFKAMISRARAGELHLHKSIFGILKREEEPQT